MAVALGWAVVCMTAILARFARGTRADRRLHAPVPLGATVLLAGFATELARSLGRSYPGTQDTDRALWLAGQAALLTVAIGVAARRVAPATPGRCWRAT